MGEHTVYNLNVLGMDRYLFEAFKAAFMAERAGFCRLLAAVRPKDEVHLDGWLERCYKWA
jgi:hypothetical protein